ncbi:MAG: hypothetical protein ACLQDY_28060 [Streptosporangiaceae bacterium]
MCKKSRSGSRLAAAGKRDVAANCADCSGATCDACQYRVATAREYETAALRLRQPEMEAG